MHHFSHHELQNLLSTYGYWAVMAFVGIESIGIPFPGETMLVAAAIYAGTTHQLDIGLVIAAATAGAVTGDNIGFWIGREFGFSLLLRYGRYIHVDERKMKLGQYLFLRWGGAVVFFGRFIAVLRTFAALLAGINRMSWGRFLVYNFAGGAVWASIFGLGGYIFGKAVGHFLSKAGIVLLVLAVLGGIVGIIIIRRNEARLEDEAERALPGPIERHIRKKRRH